MAGRGAKQGRSSLRQSYTHSSTPARTSGFEHHESERLGKDESRPSRSARCNASRSPAPIGSLDLGGHPCRSRITPLESALAQVLIPQASRFCRIRIDKKTWPGGRRRFVRNLRTETGVLLAWRTNGNVWAGSSVRLTHDAKESR